MSTRVKQAQRVRAPAQQAHIATTPSSARVKATLSSGGSSGGNIGSKGMMATAEEEEEEEEEDEEEEDEEEEEEENESPVDSEDGMDSEDDSSDGFEKQSSSDEDEEGDDEDEDDDDDDEEEEEEEEEEVDAARKVLDAEARAREWALPPPPPPLTGRDRLRVMDEESSSGHLAVQQFLHTDDLSSDDEEGFEGNNTIGRVPLHWYDAYDHIGYNVQGGKVMKRGKGGKDRIDMALDNRDGTGERTVYDMYNDREVVLSQRDLEIIRRLQAGAFAHPEHNDTPDYVDYESSIKEVMPLSAAPEPKRRFVPSKWETMKVPVKHAHAYTYMNTPQTHTYSYTPPKISNI